MAWDNGVARHNRARLRALVHAPDAPAVFCTHDPVEFLAMAAWSARQPARISMDAVLA